MLTRPRRLPRFAILTAIGVCASLLGGCANVGIGIPLGPLPISLGVSASNAGWGLGVGTGIGPIGVSAPLTSGRWESAPPPPHMAGTAPNGAGPTAFAPPVQPLSNAPQ